MGLKISEQSQGDGTSSLSRIFHLFSFAHSILMSLRQWKMDFQARITLNDNIDIHTRRSDYRKSWPTHIVSTVIHRSLFLVQGSITHLGSKEHNMRLLPIMQQNCSRIMKWYIHRNSVKKLKISFFSYSRLSHHHLLLKLKITADVSYFLFKITKILYADPDRVYNTLVSLLTLGTL